MGLFGSNIYIMSIISHRRYNFESSIQYYCGKPYIYWCVQSHPEDRGDFGQGSTENISECNNLLELSVYNMWCSNMVLTNPHMKFRIEFIIMKIFMKIVKICPKSPRFTVIMIVVMIIITIMIMSMIWQFYLRARLFTVYAIYFASLIFHESGLQDIFASGSIRDQGGEQWTQKSVLIIHSFSEGKK